MTLVDSREARLRLKRWAKTVLYDRADSARKAVQSTSQRSISDQTSRAAATP